MRNQSRPSAYKKKYEGNVRSEIIRILLYCGCLPLKSLALLPLSTTTLQKKITEMEMEGVLKKERNKEFWFATLNEFEKNVVSFEKYYPKVLIEYYRKFGGKDASKARQTEERKRRTTPLATERESELGVSAFKSVEKSKAKKIPTQDARRMIGNSESVMFFYGGGIKSIVGQKPLLRSNAVTDNDTYYYTSREVKAYTGLTGEKIENKAVEQARINGLCISSGGSYPIFHFGKNMIDISTRGERKAKIYIDNMLAEKDLKQTKGCIILHKNDGIYESLLFPQNELEKKRSEGIFLVYRNVYLLSLDKQGQNMMDLMTISEWEERILSMALPREVREGVRGLQVDCDGFLNDTYHFVYCIPNIGRLRNFCRLAELNGDRRKHIVYCYKHDETLLQEVIGDICTIKSTPFENLYKHMKGI